MYDSEQNVSLVKRAKNGSTIVFRKMTAVDFPEVRITQSLFKDEMVISNTNPQQKEYNWTKVELVSWKNYEGVPLEGLLYVPENFDPSKKYPMLVYYYELHSDDLHTHYVPKPTASIIYPTEYASAGYVVFIPDIRYVPGRPAKSAFSSIMSGTDFLLKNYPFIDSTRMGLQGQSWGGYQTAQLITMTDRFHAAMAGAPVSNMFSAYGGIRWGSGLNRQFQYEKGQSRIGKTIWEAPDLYVENSPLFHLPKVTTPLLIMANDKDGAVPWYQGIELFTAMRRLGKPCWMLNYNGEEHNLMENANRMDLSIRMRQFFDHFLLGNPAPAWLEQGIPALMKGKTMGLDFAEPQTDD
jgi:dipeptidyl aminopeptidase/acylaminoacyl peptidase